MSGKKYPLTKQQLGIWLDWKLNPTSAAYNNSIKFSLQGDLDIEKFVNACELFVKYTDTMRTKFSEIDGDIYQEFTPYDDDANVYFLDLSKSSIDTAKHKAAILIKQQEEMAFDLLRGFVYKFFVIKLARDLHYFFYVSSHIIFDHNSAEITKYLISVIYNKGEDYLEKLLIDKNNKFELYLNVAKEITIDKENSQFFWSSYLKNAQLGLNVNKIIDDRNKLDGSGEIRFKIESNDYQNLRSFARQHKITNFIFLMVCFKALVFRYFGQEDLTLAYPISKRSKQEEFICGMFTNVHLLRSFLTENLLFTDLIKNIVEDLKKIKQFRQSDFIDIISALNNYNASKRLDLFLVETTFSLNGFELNGIQSESLGTGFGRGRAKLVLAYDANSKESLELSLKYNLDYIDDNSAQQFVSNFVNFVNQVTKNDQELIGAIDFLDDEQRANILNLLDPITQAKAALKKDQKPQKNIGRLQPNFSLKKTMENKFKNHDDFPALVQGDKILSYNQLNAASNRLLHYLSNEHIRDYKNIKIAVLIGKSFDQIIALLAVVKMGCCYVPLDPKLPVERINFMLQDAGVKYVITDTDYPLLKATIINLNKIKTLLNFMPSSNSKISYSVTRDFYLIYTSGSTGKPKSVVIKQNQAISRFNWLTKNFALDRGTAILQNINFSFDPSVYEIFWSLCMGYKLILPLEEESSNPEKLIGLIDKHKVKLMTFVPSFARYFIGLVDNNCKSLKNIIMGGEALNGNLLAQIYDKLGVDIKICNVYGSTEASIITTSYICKFDDINKAKIPIGKAIDDTKLLILNDNLQLQPINVAGELYIGGSAIATNYLNCEDLTKERFVNILINNEESLYYKTGDLVKLLPCGNIEFITRIDNQVKIRGYRVELDEIELQVKLCDNIKDACVIYDEADAILYCAYIPTQNNIKNITDALKANLAQKLPHYMLPHKFVNLQDFPRLISGKIDKKFLLQQIKNLVIVTDINLTKAESVTNPDLKTKLALLWQQVLKLPEIKDKDNFFAIGGDSFRAIKLFNLIKENICAEYKIETIYDYPVFADFVANFNIKNTKSREVKLSNLALPSFIVNNQTKGIYSKLNKDSKVLLTGGSGYVGGHLLYHLQQIVDGKIYCFARGSNVRDAFNRIKNNLNDLGLWQDHLVRKIEIILGDLGEDNLALTPNIYNKLISEIDIVYNSAAEVDFIKNYESLEKPNVIATKNIIEFCFQGKIKTLHQISTESIFQSNYYYGRYEYLEEDTELIAVEELHNGYAQTKQVAEKIVIEAAYYGLPCYIHRASLLLGGANGSALNKKELFNRFVKSCIEIGAYPAINFIIYLATINYFIMQLMKLSISEHIGSNILHIFGQKYYMLEVFSWINLAGYRMKALPYKDWLAQIESDIARNPANPLTNFLPLLTRKIDKEDSYTILEALDVKHFPKIEDKKTLKLLKDHNLFFNGEIINQKTFVQYLQTLMHEEAYIEKKWLIFTSKELFI